MIFRRGTGQRGEEPALERLVRLSRRALALERAQRLLAALATLALVFLALSFAGLWLPLGGTERALGVGAFIFAALAILALGLAAGAPGRAEALARLDAAPGAEPRLASALEDTLAGERPEPATRALWALHRARLERRLAALTVAPPDAGLPRRDPFALRAGALAAALAAAFAAGPERSERLAAAFDWGAGPAAAGGETARVDAWLDPPAYTGRPAIVLPRRAEGRAAEITAPVNSTLIVRSFGGRGVIAAKGGLAAQAAAARPVSGETEERFTLTGAARLSLRGVGEFQLDVVPDRPPSIDWAAPPRNNARGTMTLAYRADDDYGVASAEAVAAAPAGGGRALYPPPRRALPLPPTASGLGEAKATLDYSDDPWAGARVALTLVARDEAGNEGASAPMELVLPERRFTRPLARALAEQRRNLALDPDHAARVATALEALSLGPDLFETPSSVFFGLATARARLLSARGDDDLREVAELLFAMALGLEEGDSSQAERELRAAQQELRDALARGAGEEEIDAAQQRLRAALAEFLNSLAKKNAGKADRGAPDDNAPTRTLTPQALEAMLAEIEKAERAGDFAEAQRLLDQLRDVLENLRPAQAGGGADPSAGEMARALDEIDRLTREQQQLRDDTGRGEPRRGAKGRPLAADDALARQKALRERLRREQDRLHGAGEAQPDFADADQAMRDAERALGPSGEGQNRALDAQGRALQALRRGADQLAERMQGRDEAGEGGRAARGEGRAGGAEMDPLGRATDRRARYDPLGLPPAVRARRVQDELRRRLGQPERPAEELDYYERLLRR